MTDDPTDFVESITEDVPPEEEIEDHLLAAQQALEGRPEPVTAYRSIETAIELVGELQNDGDV